MQSTSTPPSGRGPMAAALAAIVITGGALAYSWFKPPRPTVESGDAATTVDARPSPAVESDHAAVEPVVVNEDDDAAPASEPLFEGWDAPAAVLVFTGEQHGFLEPCGCTSGQTGGLARRADLMRTLRQDRQWPTAGLDLGGQLRDERAKRPQEQLKFETTRAALKLMDFDLAGLGPEELRFGADSLYTLFSEEQTEGDVSPQFVCANVSLFEPPGPDYQLEIPAPFRILQVGDLKVGVTSIVGSKHWAKVFGTDQTIDQTLFGYVDAAEALDRVLPLMQAEQPDVLVLLSHADVEQSRELAERFGDFDVVVTAGGPEDGREKAEQVNDTLLLQVGHKGKHAGIIGVFPEGAEPRLRFELVELNGDQFAHSPVIHELLEAYVAELDAQHPNLQETLAVSDDAATYVGAERCGGCHSKAYEIWKKTPHSHAYDSLYTGRPDDPDYIVRIKDPECLCCHVVGWHPQQVQRYPTGFIDEASTPHLAGQQCENCHGAGSHHVELEDAWDGGDVTEEMETARESLRVTKESARTGLCLQCHDPDNSPQFDTPAKPFDTYWWPKVEHYGTD